MDANCNITPDDRPPLARSKPEMISNGSRSKLSITIGKTVIFMTIVSFLFVGLFINLIQLILTFTIKFSDNQKWRTAHKILNGQLVYILFSPPICLIYYWSNATVNIQLADKNLIEDAKKPLVGIMIPNHSYELDYMICFVLADQLGNLGAYKSFSKKELKYLPIVGWSMWMSDIIFVERNWEQDRKGLARKLDQLLDYEQTLLGLFAEGTRWTPDKHEASTRFARSRGLEPLKYHLTPRPRGFNYTVRHFLRHVANKRIDENIFRLFSLQIVMPDRPNFRDFLNGQQLRADVYCEEVIISPELKSEVLASKDEDDCPGLTKLLHDIYKRKDTLVDSYKENGDRFIVDPERGGPFPFKRGKLAPAIWFIGFCFTYSVLSYLAVTVFFNSVIFWSVLTSFIGCCAWMLKKIEHESRAKSLTRSDTSTLSAGYHSDHGDREPTKCRLRCP